VKSLKIVCMARPIVSPQARGVKGPARHGACFSGPEKGRPRAASTANRSQERTVATPREDVQKPFTDHARAPPRRSPLPSRIDHPNFDHRSRVQSFESPPRNSGFMNHRGMNREEPVTNHPPRGLDCSDLKKVEHLSGR
jgi:hypothetical protein